MERLNRAFVNDAWVQRYPFHKLYSRVCPTSYHSPIKLVVKARFSTPRVRRFKFEKFWLSETGFFDVIADAWFMVSNGSVSAKLSNCVFSLS